MASGAGETKGNGRKKADLYKQKNWDNARPSVIFFNELQRVSSNQIIFGANYFADLLPPSRGWVYWRKLLGGDYSDGELAYTSFDKVLKSSPNNRNAMGKESTQLKSPSSCTNGF